MTIKKAFENVNVLYFNENFETWFFPMDFNTEKVNPLIGTKLPRSMDDFEIQKELKPIEVTLEEIAATLKNLDHATWCIFYTKDAGGVLRSVYVRWRGVGWCACAIALGGYRWSDGDQVFSRNSCNPETLVVRDPLVPGYLDSSLESRVAKLEAWKEKLTDAWGGK